MIIMKLTSPSIHAAMLNQSAWWERILPSPSFSATLFFSWNLEIPFYLPHWYWLVFVELSSPSQVILHVQGITWGMGTIPLITGKEKHTPYLNPPNVFNFTYIVLRFSCLLKQSDLSWRWFCCFCTVRYISVYSYNFKDSYQSAA